MKISSKAKSIIKKVALVLAGITAITAVAFGVKAIVDYTKNDLKEINPGFEVGNLGSDGKYVADEGSLYTKEAFPCDGLQIKPDFDSTVNYQIFFYDDLDNFIESTPVLSESYSGGNHDSYARLVITPRNDEDEKISWMEKKTYSRQLEIKTKKEAAFQYVTFYGKRLRCVDDVSFLRYELGDFEYNSDIGAFHFLPHARYAVTSKDLLCVKKSSKIRLETHCTDYDVVLHVKECYSSGDNFLCFKQEELKNGEECTLNARTEFCIFVYELHNPGGEDAIIISSDLLSRSLTMFNIIVSK